MNLYAVTAVYGADRDAAFVLAEDDDAVLALAGRGHDPRGLGTDRTEVWLVARDCKQVGELPATPAQLAWPAPGEPAAARSLAEVSEPSAIDLLRDATGP
jgi:hypothetical protein